MRYSLLPCPFCGSKVEVEAGGCAEYYGHEHQDMWIECKCGLQLTVDSSTDFPCSCHYDLEPELVRRWNTRYDGDRDVK